ncbi:T9SS type A sorting domain-containing protein [Chitinophagales bacterium]|nr:T9SS type A sorting domain-containing protein [Chitinophagales bacterium]
MKNFGRICLVAIVLFCAPLVSAQSVTGQASPEIDIVHGFTGYEIKIKTGIPTANDSDLFEVREDETDIHIQVVDQISGVSENQPRLPGKETAPEPELLRIVTAYVYPNPASDFFYLEVENFPGASIIVYNAIGQVVWNGSLTDSRIGIDSSAWSDGMYFVEVANEVDRKVQRVEVIR